MSLMSGAAVRESGIIAVAQTCFVPQLWLLRLLTSFVVISRRRKNIIVKFAHRTKKRSPLGWFLGTCDKASPLAYPFFIIYATYPSCLFAACIRGQN